MLRAEVLLSGAASATVRPTQNEKRRQGVCQAGPDPDVRRRHRKAEDAEDKRGFGGQAE